MAYCPKKQPLVSEWILIWICCGLLPKKNRNGVFPVAHVSPPRLREISAKHLQVVSALVEPTPSPVDVLQNPQTKWSFYIMENERESHL